MSSGLLDPSNRRHGQDGCDALQEGSAGILRELVLHRVKIYFPESLSRRTIGCCTVLVHQPFSRMHAGELKTLHRLVEAGIKMSKEHGRSELFELEEETRDALKAAAAATGGGRTDGKDDIVKLPPHAMASYNWDPQSGRDYASRVKSSISWVHVLGVG